MVCFDLLLAAGRGGAASTGRAGHPGSAEGAALPSPTCHGGGALDGQRQRASIQVAGHVGHHRVDGVDQAAEHQRGLGRERHQGLNQGTALLSAKCEVPG